MGGAARFATALRAQAASKPLVLFSGDVFNPSLMSTVTKGKVRPNRFFSCRPHHMIRLNVCNRVSCVSCHQHMVPILNELGVHCSVFGNQYALTFLRLTSLCVCVCGGARAAWWLMEWAMCTATLTLAWIRS